MAATDRETWQVVQRRRRYPNHWRPGPIANLATLTPRTQTYLPYQASPTYAQVVASMAPLSAAPRLQSPPPPTPPASPTPPSSPQSPSFYISPHSPERLRFPPSSRFPEWKGRCFKCCRKGHSVSACRNPLKCGKCWKTGHTGNKCKARLNPAAPPFKPAIAAPKRPSEWEPGFGNLLAGPRPLNPHPMPPNRPPKMISYVDRDGEHYHEIAKLQQSAVILYAACLHFQISVAKVAEYAAETKLVQPHELKVSMWTKGRYIILLPDGLAPETFIDATPQSLWDMGLTFQKWNQLEGATLHNPTYRVLIDIVGLPPHLYRERQIVRAVSGFGLYLGSVAQQHQSDISSWSAVVAVRELEEVPFSVALVEGGLEYVAEIRPVMWHHEALFKGSDMPTPPPLFTGPKPVSPDEPEPTAEGVLLQDTQTSSDDEEIIPMSKRVLLQLCEGRPLNTIPLAIRRVLTGKSPGVRDWAPLRELLDGNSAICDPAPNEPVADAARHRQWSPTHQDHTQQATPMELTADLAATADPAFTNTQCVAGLSTNVAQEFQVETTVQETIVQETQAEPLPHPIQSPHQSPHQKSLTPSLAPSQESQGEARLPEEIIPVWEVSAINPPRTERLAENVLQDNMVVTQELIASGQDSHVPREEELLPTHSQLKLLRSSVRLKRRPDLQVTFPPRAAGPKKRGSKAITAAQNSAGLFEVQVQYSHAACLAQALGVTAQDIQQVVQEDNKERAACGLPLALTSSSVQQDTTVVPPDRRISKDGLPIYGDDLDNFFEPCPEDELDTDMDED
ncbi:hypothetical protein FCM35_KLT19125 [Carex littledalei]|uniref:CCHC-type domain-containing protein n=1 Tax=Carex littledalei TaxID=544730 RepID=A0A833VXE3_9POAL|nr:hypothetical protein FCM35_KLT19125 [Carex littledalei]